MWANLPRFFFGVIVGTYWLRVIHLARKIRRREGHSANVIPPGVTGKMTRIVWFPVVILWIAIPLSSPFVRFSGWAMRPLFNSVVAQIAGLIVAIVAFVLTLVCWKKMGTSWRMGVDPSENTALITTGPYSRIRHPIYALSSLLMLATVVALATPLLLLIAVFHLILLQLEARREERHLADTHGPAYSEYVNRTGRFLPKFA
jgi:protein-S-isoprenylcysteine O-methyltransferase Ste14